MKMHRQINLLAVALVTIAMTSVACSSSNESNDTSLPNISIELERSSGVYSVSETTRLWVTDKEEVLISAEEIAEAHRFVLDGQAVTFPDASTGIPQAVVNDDQSIVAVPVETAAGLRGIALISNTGYEMALYIYGDASEPAGSVKFMPEAGLTLMSLGGENASRLVAFNNYGMKQFDLPVKTPTGVLRYSPDDPNYLVIDRRPVVEELELVPLSRPGQTTIFRPSSSFEAADELYRTLSMSIANWR